MSIIHIIYFVYTLCNCMVLWYVSVEPSSTSIDHVNLRHRIDSRPCEMCHFAQSASRRRPSTLLCPWTQPDKLRKASPGGPTLENVALGLGMWTCRMPKKKHKQLNICNLLAVPYSRHTKRRGQS